jgi:hypothetical protein
VLLLFVQLEADEKINKSVLINTQPSEEFKSGTIVLIFVFLSYETD